MKATGSGGVCGYDAGKRIKGCKRHIVTDVLGPVLVTVVHAADIQDRDGAPGPLKAVGKKFPWLRHISAGGGYAGDRLRQATGDGWTLETIKRPDAVKGFVPLPGRWVVERTIVWLGRCRRLARDWESTVESPTTWAHIACIRLVTRRLARHCNAT